MPAVATESKTTAALVTCTKCCGCGRFRVCSVNTGRVFDNGPCFECEGTGKITESKRETSRWTNELAGRCNYTANIVLLAARDGLDDRAEHYMTAMLKDLFIMGTTHARKVLATLAAGEWFDDDAYSTDGTRGRIPADRAAALRARVIEMGRAARA